MTGICLMAQSCLFGCWDSSTRDFYRCAYGKTSKKHNFDDVQIRAYHNFFEAHSGEFRKD